MCSGAVHRQWIRLELLDPRGGQLPTRRMQAGGTSTQQALPLLCSKSDAMAVLFASDGYKSERWSEVGRTDTVANSLTPEFRKPLRATYQVFGSGVGGGVRSGLGKRGKLFASPAAPNLWRGTAVKLPHAVVHHQAVSKRRAIIALDGQPVQKSCSCQAFHW